MAKSQNSAAAPPSTATDSRSQMANPEAFDINNDNDSASVIGNVNSDGAAIADYRHPVIPCKEFTLFKQALGKLRKVDDFVVQKLNTAIPTDIFKNAESAETKHRRCSQFYEEFQVAYADRRSAIGHCIESTEVEVERLREERARNRDDMNLNDMLADAQSRLRMMQSELVVESIIEERSMKIFNERCSSFDVIG